MRMGIFSALIIATIPFLSPCRPAQAHIPTALEILELPTGASQEDVIQAYKGLLKKYHPDSAKTDRYRAQLTEVIEAYKFIKDRNFNTKDLTSSFSAKSPEKKKVEEVLREDQHLIQEPTNILILILRADQNLKTLEDYRLAAAPVYKALIQELQAQQPSKTQIEIIRDLTDDVFTHLKEDKDHPHGNYLLSEALFKVSFEHLNTLHNTSPQESAALKQRALKILEQLENTTFAYDVGALYQRLSFELVNQDCANQLKK